jgi:hypothetical protein
LPKLTSKEVRKVEDRKTPMSLELRCPTCEAKFETVTQKVRHKCAAL